MLPYCVTSFRWLAIGVGMVMHVMKHKTYKGIYIQMQRQILFFQTCALFEVTIGDHKLCFSKYYAASMLFYR